MKNDFSEVSRATGPARVVLPLAIFFVYVLMVFGNIVTTTGSGLACPDWPLCHGTVNPPKELAIWIEWGHRLTGAVSGILILLSAALMWNMAGAALKFIMKSVVAFIFAAVALGGLIIIADAPLLDSAARIAVVSSHIIVATIIFTAMIIAHRGAFGAEPAARAGGLDLRRNGLPPLWLFVAVYFQVTLGVLVRYSHSSLACPDWPLCQGSLFPPNLMPEVLLHYLHRLTAYAIFLVAAWNLYVSAGRGGPLLEAAATLGLVTTQAAVGVGIVLTQMFLPLLVLHGAVGFLLLGWT
ncbi:MAG: heme A synthase, partial [Nitrospinae bacterium]|nr:heme A synthase [Nitrospinota bacterium]